jgi:hypothetical protein
VQTLGPPSDRSEQISKIDDIGCFSGQLPSGTAHDHPGAVGHHPSVAGRRHRVHLEHGVPVSAAQREGTVAAVSVSWQSIENAGFPSDQVMMLAVVPVSGSVRRQRWPGRTLWDSRAWAYLAMKPGEDPIDALMSEFTA